MLSGKYEPTPCVYSHICVDVSASPPLPVGNRGASAVPHPCSDSPGHSSSEGYSSAGDVLVGEGEGVLR